ncbi:MAG: 3-deoxy-D-manno-octulosonic acid transferase [Betaproteobacteria bacterium]|nr:3-deoxy-D-manno-octulosonic acid transferase [Betaproteobacteria bacterium]
MTRARISAAAERHSFLSGLLRAAYTVLGTLLLPLLATYLAWRARRQPAYWQHWGERFLGIPRHAGPYAFSQLDRPVIWLHAVSVGETHAAQPLVKAWLASGKVRVLLTHTTPTGRQTGATLFGDESPEVFVQAYLPYDLPWANARFLRWARPSLGLLMETELWPNLLAQARSRGIPMALINARLSHRSARSLRRFSSLARPALGALSLVLAQTHADAQRFMANGYAGALELTGSLKFDVETSVALADLGREWRAAWPHRWVWLVISSRDDEEIELFRSWQLVRPRGALLLVVPRHPQRFERVADLARTAGLKTAQRSQDLVLNAEVECLIGDSLGEMSAYVAASDLALIGGSLLPLGGQNPIEACAQGRPVFFGPAMFNFQAIARELRDCGAGFEVGSVAEFYGSAQLLMEDAKAYERACSAAKDFAVTHQGASARTLRALDRLLSVGAG